MSDSADRHRADLFEIELRRKADLDPGNSWELVWFLKLPLEVRCSYMRILEARIDQDATRKFLARQSCYSQRNWREPAHACLALEVIEGPSRPWASIGRRQRRKPAEPRHPASRRRRQLTQESTKPTRPKPKQEPDLYQVPPRPVTPNGLREALSAIPSLACNAAGYATETLDNGHLQLPRAPITPLEPLPPPNLELTANPAPAPPEVVEFHPFCEPPPDESFLVVDDIRIPADLSYFLAAGRYHRLPEDGYTTLDAAFGLLNLEYGYQQFFDHLVQAFSSLGDHALVALDARATEDVLDLVRGWTIVPQALADGNWPTPDPHPRCPCCTCRR